MEYDYHIVSKYLVLQIKNLVFLSKALNSYLEFEILGISIEIPSISKTCDFD